MTDAMTMTRPCVQAHHTDRCDACKVRSLAVCAALSPEELCDLEALVHHVEADAKTTFIRQDEPAGAVFSLTGGVVRLYKLISDGRRQVVGFALPGDFLGLSLADRYAFSADAVDEVKLCRFERAPFERLVSSKPHLLRRLHEFATHELVIAQEQMTLIGRRSAEERIASFIVSLQARWSRVRGPSVTVQLPMQRVDIADYLGLTIETVSRTLTRLARERVILIVPEAVRILDDDRLRRIAG